MKRDGRYWYTATLIGDRFNSNQGFFFATPDSRMYLGKTGFATSEGSRFNLADFQGRQEMWIVVDTSGPVGAPPVILLEPPKIVNVFNPWPVTGPRVVFAGGATKKMIMSPDHCGWFTAFLFKPGEMSLHFQEINGTGTYGSGGMGSSAEYDMADTALRSYETCADIPMSKTGDGQWEYDSYPTPEHGFFPIDDFANPNNEKVTSSCYNVPNTSNWVTSQARHNMNFCMESHAAFVYQPGQRIEFRGDDDAWMFINGKLVLDLGGPHTPQSDTVDLDKLSLIPGNQYAWDFFYCDRQPCGSSLRLKTSIYFKQVRLLDTVTQPGVGGSIHYRIVKRQAGAGKCANFTDTFQVVEPANLVYALVSDTGATVLGLTQGAGSFFGGIRIEGATAEIYASRLTGLPPGLYHLSAYESSNPAIRVNIRFRIESPVALRKPRATVAPRRLRQRWHDILGRVFPSRGTRTQQP